MKIKVWENKVLDTERSEIIDSNNFDESCVGLPIFFNIHKEGAKVKCSVADAKNVRTEQDYNSMVAICKKIGKEPKVHIAKNGKELLIDLRVYEKNSKVAKSEKVKRDKAEENEKRLTPETIGTQDLSKEERESIVKENVEKAIRKGIVIDYDHIKENKDDDNYKIALSLYQEALVVLEKVAPFYHGIIFNLDHKFTSDPRICPTMGVTTSELIINTEFIQRLKFGEILFVLSHEAGHITFKHPARIHKRNHSIWNIAGDLVINKILAEEYDITPKKGNTLENGKYEIEFAHGGLYCDKIDPSKDTVESVYDELYDEFKKQQQSQNGGKQGQGNGQGSGNGGGGGGQQGEQNQSQSGGSGNNSNGEENKEQGNQQSSGGGNLKGNKQDKQNGNGGSQGQGQDQQDQDQQGSGSGLEGQDQNDDQTIEVDFRGQKIKFKPEEHKDVYQSKEDDELAKESEETVELENKCQNIIDAGKQAQEQAEKNRGVGIGGRIRDIYELVEMRPEKWYNLLKKYAKKSIQKKKDIMKPSRYAGTVKGYIGFGQKKLKNKITNVLLAIDTSGSMSDKDIAEAVGRVVGLFKKYKDNISGRICYWGSNIESEGEFRSVEEALKIKSKGGGGTDINCVMDYINEHDIEIPIIFTDGYVGTVTKRIPNSVKYKTIWCLYKMSDYKNFDEPFGRKTM